MSLKVGSLLIVRDGAMKGITSRCLVCKRGLAFTVAMLGYTVQNPFQRSRELDGLSKALVDLPKAALYVGALVFVAASGALGSVLGTRAPGAAVHSCKPRAVCNGNVHTALRRT